MKSDTSKLDTSIITQKIHAVNELIDFNGLIFKITLKACRVCYWLMIDVTQKRFFLKNLILSAVQIGCDSSQRRVAMIRIVIIDGKDSDRKDTEKILSAQGDFNVVATGKDGYEAIRLVDAYRPDMLLLDINLSYLDGIKTASILNSRYPLMAVIILTQLDDARHMRNAINNGVSGYLLKNKDMEKLADVIRVIHDSGCLIFPRDVMEFAREEQCSKADRQFPPNLSRMELKILRCVGGGLENQEIAEKMHLKTGTIRNHISMILHKTGLRNRTQLAIFAVQNGLEEEAPVA
jgi:DNA-binding NarL/FixJ family response regulator